MILNIYFICFLTELNCKLLFHYLAENILLSFMPGMICQRNIISHLKQILLTFIWKVYVLPAIIHTNVYNQDLYYPQLVHIRARHNH